MYFFNCKNYNILSTKCNKHKILKFLNLKRIEKINLGILMILIIGKFNNLNLNKFSLSYNKVASLSYSHNIEKSIFSNVKVLLKKDLWSSVSNLSLTYFKAL